MRMNPVVLFLLSVTTFATAAKKGNPFIAGDDVTWPTLGTNENSSMPLGNGDVALNVWTERNGDIVLLIAKSDSWSENGELLKPDRVRVSLEPNPFVNSASFTQILRLETGYYSPVKRQPSVLVPFEIRGDPRIEGQRRSRWAKLAALNPAERGIDKNHPHMNK